MKLVFPQILLSLDGGDFNVFQYNYLELQNFKNLKLHGVFTTFFTTIKKTIYHNN